MNKVILVLMLLLTTGCATKRVVDWDSSSVVNALPPNIQGSRFSIFPMDAAKATKLETVVVEKNLVDTLQKKGLVYEPDPKLHIPNYFVLYDYASDYGVVNQYEHAVLIVFYAMERKPKQVFKARLKIESINNDTVKNVNLAVIELANKIAPDAPQGDKK